jgi:hypothetical protein
LQEYEEGLKMPYVTSVERIGIKKGMRQGMQQGEIRILLRQMRLKFGEARTEALRSRVEAADADTLLRWSERLLFAVTPDEMMADD